MWITETRIYDRARHKDSRRARPIRTHLECNVYIRSIYIMKAYTRKQMPTYY
ncbi:hypothetical protein HanRHA438_Chr04g0175731 [Helianthus annuus]|uniref:Uncharacterized protein n=1 Tax=Helianthus annuus TaxID=4232 RepID=A0A9K3NSD6_HELAN|nr:hypothetical protein HanXRQr2_Chr04g0166101 [Helianthus annuus]KAJ0926821.1 hypothetical protein HanRHA438_Chr04g0175731 [Helianthus annuus]KAJ0931276.1 hypothetical protein HanPSC8_Chr04g0159751 [Helianthus annuus]